MISALSRTPRVISALIMREMTTTYGRSPGGYLWVIAEPLGGIVALSLAFSLLVRNPPLGVNFPLFYASGVLMMNMFSDVSNKIGSSIKFSKPLLAYPSVTFSDAIMARFLLNGMTQVVVVYLIMGGIMLLYDTRAVVSYPDAALALAMALALGLGQGSLNCFLSSLYPLYERVWNIATRPLLLISGVFYTFESLPASVQALLIYNPLVHIVGQMRRGFYPDYAADYVNLTYVWMWAGIAGVFGLFLLRRYYRVILYEL